MMAKRAQDLPPVPLRYDKDEIERIAAKEWWRVLARLAEIGLPVLTWLSMVNIDEVRVMMYLRNHIFRGGVCPYGRKH
jgi:hypothetical protein